MKAKAPNSQKKTFAVIGTIILVVAVLALLLSPGALAWTIRYAAEGSLRTSGQFPVTVDPSRKAIEESPQVNAFLANEHSLYGAAIADAGAAFWNALSNLAVSFSDAAWYDSLASVAGRIVVVKPGMRKEEVAAAFAKALGWTAKQQKEFLVPKPGADLPLSEGSFAPDAYVVAAGTTPEEAQKLVNDQFRADVLSHYGTTTAEKVPLNQALTIASLIQRETISNDGMRLLSGIMWNRIFSEMNLQVDATLQYAKANRSATGSWWPAVLPRDKYIKSPYNTYQNAGLPPTPISNPSVAAVLAALNPVATPCLFYFNDKSGTFHCSATYADHVKLLDKYY